MTPVHTRTAVVALGDHALAPPGAASDAAARFRQTRESPSPVVALVLDGWRVCVVQDDRRQVGDGLLRDEVARPRAGVLRTAGEAQPRLRRPSPNEAARLDGAGTFGEPSVAPKVRAAMHFVRRTGGRAIIAELSRGREAVLGLAGTTITPEST
jgi:carbamate kinase